MAAYLFTAGHKKARTLSQLAQKIGVRATALAQTVADEPATGLYATGRTAVGICSNSYISGLSLADCIFSGRRAGLHAAGQSHVAV